MRETPPHYIFSGREIIPGEVVQLKIVKDFPFSASEMDLFVGITVFEEDPNVALLEKAAFRSIRKKLIPDATPFKTLSPNPHFQKNPEYDVGLVGQFRGTRKKLQGAPKGRVSTGIRRLSRGPRVMKQTCHMVQVQAFFAPSLGFLDLGS